ncbi:hypothetical protein bthur0001_41190 [Bacillus thuringiensis serovar tochigiensis BGSC 4Y1]|nr:hypothetical protein bthur0001_41190 [Bacillus thuringiensis serovar tochigiensis BGSC 4Y1]
MLFINIYNSFYFKESIIIQNSHFRINSPTKSHKKIHCTYRILGISSEYFIIKSLSKWCFGSCPNSDNIFPFRWNWIPLFIFFICNFLLNCYSFI